MQRTIQQSTKGVSSYAPDIRHKHSCDDRRKIPLLHVGISHVAERYPHPHLLKSVFDLDYAQTMLVQFAFFSSYFVFAFPAGKVIEWTGYKRTMVIGLITMTIGALLFIPASRIPSFALFRAAGSTFLQVAANSYVANLGLETTASSRLNLAQAFNSLGTFLAPIFAGGLPSKQALLRSSASACTHRGRHPFWVS